MRVVIINGRGGSGKDTVCEMAQDMIGVGYCCSISTVDIIKDWAEMMFTMSSGLGWDGKKDEKGRRLLADLKDAWQRYDEGPRKHVIKKAEYMGRLWGEKGLLFIHSREPEDIKELLKSLANYNPVTLLVKNPNIGDHGNHADDNAEDYGDYDYIISNSGSLQELRSKVRDFLEAVSHQK